MKLVIAEKPSLAKKIKECLEQRFHVKFTSKDGYWDSDTIRVTSVFGHLFTVCDLRDYDEKWKSWTGSYGDLPFTLDSYKKMKFKMKDDEGTKERYKIIKDLLKDTDTVIHAGDADREGEVIVRNVLNAAKYKGNVKRLWLPAQDIDTIEEALKTMKDDSEYNDLANEGITRTITDALYGFNLTRYLTCIGGELYKVGSVKVPIVEAIYDREIEIRNFKPVTYYGVSHTDAKDDIKYTLNSARKFDVEADAKAYADTLNKEDLVVADVKESVSTMKPKHLFSLTTLQNAMAKRFKYTADVTLANLQKLYDAGYVTYPRTDTEYLAESEKDTVKQVIRAFGDPNIKFKDSSFIFDSSKVEAHSALMPTRQVAKPESLGSEEERNIYNAIVNRFKANFCATDCKVAKTKITFECESELFTLNGKTIQEPGWTVYEEPDSKDTIIPAFTVGKHVSPKFVSVEKQTKPKAHYTVETLNNFLENPFKDELSDEKSDDDYKELLKGLSIGTVATRAGIIKQLVDANYITLTKVTYGITDSGERMVETIRNHNVPLSKEKTISLGGYLKDVYRREKTIDDVVEIVNEELREVCDTSKPIAARRNSDGSVPNRNAICKCPKCGGDIIKGKRKSDGSTLYYCANFKKEGDAKCNFIVGASMKYFDNVVPLTDAKVKALCSGKKIKAKVKTKDGHERDAKLKLAFNGNWINLEEVKKEGGSASKREIGKCPKCGAGVVYKANNKDMYYCSRFADESDPCSFRLFNPMRFFKEEVKLSEDDIKNLCKGLSITKNIKDKYGNKRPTELKLVFNGDWTNLERSGNDPIHVTNH